MALIHDLIAKCSSKEAYETMQKVFKSADLPTEAAKTMRALGKYYEHNLYVD